VKAIAPDCKAAVRDKAAALPTLNGIMVYDEDDDDV
jgi:hypothetical protein